MSNRTTSDLTGALVIDKPAGMSSHDVVAAVRRALGGTKVGHTGTLDPDATGVLPLLLGRATRLAQFMTAATKRYEADVQFGWSTTTYDAAGAAVGPAVPVEVDRDRLDAALDGFRGTFLQQPPAYSAKKIAGTRAYALARENAAPVLDAVPVRVDRLEILDLSGSRARLDVSCSSGFYVRSLAHDLGQALGTGAHLCGLRRIRSGDFTLDAAVPLEAVLRRPESAAQFAIEAARLLPELPSVRLTPAGIERVRHGAQVGPRDCEGVPPAGAARVKLLTGSGALAAVAAPATDGPALQPIVVLL